MTHDYGNGQQRSGARHKMVAFNDDQLGFPIVAIECIPCYSRNIAESIVLRYKSTTPVFQKLHGC